MTVTRLIAGLIIIIKTALGHELVILEDVVIHFVWQHFLIYNEVKSILI